VLYIHTILVRCYVYVNSATAIEEAGGPVIDMKYGRVDAAGPEGCTPDVSSAFKLVQTSIVL
jgi:hypothetical protein